MSKMMSAVVAAAGLASSVCAAADDPLAAYRWHQRVVVALAPSEATGALREQRRVFARMGPAARERDLALVVALDGTPAGAALRRRFGGTGFRAVLVGKDGGEKLVADRPLGPDVLFPLIDAMPMRQDEMRRAR